MEVRQMSKWVDDSAFKSFRERKKTEDDNKPSGGNDRMSVVWKTPEKGTTDRPKIYEGRFLQDPKGVFYLQYLYHMFKNSSGEGWHFSLCPKTYDMSKYCPWCSVVSKLYSSGSKSDKSAAYNYKRKIRFCGNWYVVKDPRDAEADEENKAEGKVFVYEFPGKVESKLKTEITDEENGYGMSIFDPGEDGVNFIVRVKATKPDESGRVFPDYSDSQFARRPTALGSEDEIEEIMKNRYDLMGHLKKMEATEDKVLEAIKKEMVWDLIEDEYERMSGSAVPSTPREQESPETEEPKEEAKEESFDDSDDDMSEQELLDELENMGME